MPQTVRLIKTYGCFSCAYTQNHNPDSDKQVEIFGEEARGWCPACFLGHNPMRVRQLVAMAEAIDLSQLGMTITKSEEDVDNTTRPVFDDNGKPILVESGEVREKLAIVDGQPTVVQEPVMVVQERPLTNDEHKAELDQIQRDLDDLEAITVAEITPEEAGLITPAVA